MHYSCLVLFNNLNSCAVDIYFVEKCYFVKEKNFRANLFSLSENKIGLPQFGNLLLVVLIQRLLIVWLHVASFFIQRLVIVRNFSVLTELPAHLNENI